MVSISVSPLLGLAVAALGAGGDASGLSGREAGGSSRLAKCGRGKWRHPRVADFDILHLLSMV